MKVDSNGQPVSEGTFGFYMGNISAKVLRTMVDPIADGEGAQEVIAEGGFVLDTGTYSGEVVASAGEFRATYDGDSVKAQDGTVLNVGDKVELTPGAAPSSPKRSTYTIASLYPIGTLTGTVCCSIEEVKGGAPDGKFGIEWGSVVKVVEKGSSVKKKKLILKTGDWVKFIDDSGNEKEGWIGTWGEKALRESPYTHGIVWKKETLQRADRELNNVDYWIKESKVLDHKRGEAVESLTTPEGERVFVGDLVKCKPTSEDDGRYFLGTVESISKDKQGIKLKITEVTDEKRDKQYIGQSLDWPTKLIVELLERGEAGQAAIAAESEDEDIITGEEEGDEMEQMDQEESQMVAKKEPKFKKVEVVAEGTQIIIPKGMTRREAVKELERQAAQDELDVAIMELIHGFPLDAAHALMQAMGQKFGWVNALPTPGFFGPQPPVMVGVVVDPDGRTVQIPWGQLGIPGISGKLSTGIQFVDNKPVFCLGGTIKQKDKDKVNEIAQMAREYLRDNSIYKGKAIRVKFPEDPKKFSPLDNQPQFIHTADIRPEELIFSVGVEKQIRINIWTPIQSLAACETARIPLKRGVLLFGRYGVGKTLLASVTARLCVQAGITFIDLIDSRQLPQAVQWGRQFGGMVVIFAEDIDRCDENGTRTDAFNEILNTVDGLTSKTDKVLIVYTTNHIERISKAMLRQGRIDKVIHIKEPDEVAAQKLVRLYARHMLSPEADLTKVGKLLQGFIPAAIREVVEQSKLAAIERGDVHNITPLDLEVTAENTKEHMDLLKEEPKDDRSELEKFGDAMGARIGEKIAARVDYDNDDAVETATEAVTAEITKRRKRAA